MSERTTEDKAAPLVPNLTTPARRTTGSRPRTDAELGRLERALGRGD